MDSPKQVEPVQLHVLCSVLEFSDGTMSVMPLQRGTLEQCQDVMKMIPAVCNSTDKTVASSYWMLPTVEEYEEFEMENEHGQS